jgi:alpha-N-arabinofuranosidase
MRKVDPTIFLIAGGAMPKTMTTAKQSLRFGKSLIPEPLSAADWNGGLLQHSLDYFDELSEHFYAYSNTHFDLQQAAQVPDDPNLPLIDVLRRPANHVRATYEDYEDYLQRIPAMRDKHITVNIDEWAMIGVPPGSYKLVPAYAWAFHEMFRHSDLFRAAAYTFGTSMLSATRNQAELSPIGELFKLYSNHFGSIPVKVSGSRPQPAPTVPVGGEQPRVNAGSDTFPIDVVAAWDEGHQFLSIAVVNPTEAQQSMKLSIAGANLARKATLLRLYTPDVNYAVKPGERSKVKVQQQSVANIAAQQTLPPYSVSVYLVSKQ